MTMCDVNGESFWGGKTYDRSSGKYIQLENNGLQLHAEWLSVDLQDGVTCLKERVCGLAMPAAA